MNKNSSTSCHDSISEKQHEEQVKRIADDSETDNILAYSSETFVVDPDIRYMDEIHEMSVAGRSIIESMSPEIPQPGWDDILILGGQLDPMPLPPKTEINTTTVIGKKAKRPMTIQTPIYVSHMSFGAISKEAKIALAKGSAAAGTAIGSGEGGILPEEIYNACKYIIEYTPNEYNITEENLKRADAIEIIIGQATKPGIGGYFPGEQITEEIAEVRKIKLGRRIIADARFKDINNKDDLKKKVEELRERSHGRPVGIKIGAERIEKDLSVCIFANPDFITVDGRGGASAASPGFLRDATTVPTLYALYRARKYLSENKSDIDLIITGGLRVSSDVAKALAMGADAVAFATAALMAIGCQQYRLCSYGKCPNGIATQDEELRRKLNIDHSAKRLTNFFNVTLEELKVFARICGKKNLHDLNLEDICTTRNEISEHTNISHV